MALILDGTAGITAPALTDAGNLTFTGTGNRITGDFSNATITNRVMFQTSATNTTTSVTAIPNGTGVQAGFQVYNNSSASAASGMHMFVNATEASLRANVSDAGGTLLPMTFYTNNAERMRIDTSGNVGIGTSSPYKPLTVNGAIASLAGYHIGGNAASPDTFCALSTRQSVSDGGAVVVRDNYGTYNAGGIEFYANGSERMRIDSSGNLLVGTTSSNSSLLGIVSKSNSSTNQALSLWNSGDSGTRYLAWFMCSTSFTNVGAISTNGTSTTYATSSDYRLKENIQPMQGALDVVAQLNPVTYTWKADGSDGQGFIAHELQAVVPDCVTGEKDAVDEEGKPVYQGIDTSFLVATLTKAIQELTARIEQLEAK